MEVVVYTDASCCRATKIAAVGYMAYHLDKCVKQVVRVITNIGEPKSQMAELYAILYALEDCFLIKNVSGINIFTDVHYFLERSSNKKYTIEKFPHLEEIRKTIRIIKEYGVNVKFFSVKSHHVNKRNNAVDQLVRGILRKYREQNNLFSGGQFNDTFNKVNQADAAGH